MPARNGQEMGKKTRTNLYNKQMNVDIEKGSWLVVVGDGSASIQLVNPDFVETKAALHHVKDAMTKAMLKAAELRPQSVPMSKKEIKAWATYEKTMGDDMPNTFQYASIHDIVEAGAKVVEEQIEKSKKKFKKRLTTERNSILDLNL